MIGYAWIGEYSCKTTIYVYTYVYTCSHLISRICIYLYVCIEMRPYMSGYIFRSLRI